MKIQKLVLNCDDQATTVTREKILTVPIKPGLPSGTEIRFPEEGDQGPTKIPGRIGDIDSLRVSPPRGFARGSSQGLLSNSATFRSHSPTLQSVF